MTTGYDHRHPRPEPSHEGIRAAYVPPCSCVFLIPGLFCTAARQVSLGGCGGEFSSQEEGCWGHSIQHQSLCPLHSCWFLQPHRAESLGVPQALSCNCQSSLSPPHPRREGWREHLPVWGAVLAPVRLYQQRNHVH